MVMFNPWWSYHCAGILEEENDPYSDKFEGIGPIRIGSLVLAMALVCFLSIIASGGVGLIVHIFFKTPWFGVPFIILDVILYILSLIFTFSKIDFY